jgi:hypothetical protein
VTIDARMRPFARAHFDFLSQILGPTTPDRIAPMPENLITGEINLARQRLFWGVFDVVPPITLVEGRPVPVGRLRDLIIGYLGTKGELGPLAQLNAWLGSLGRGADAIGRQLGLFRRQRGDWVVFSFQPGVLNHVMPRLTLAPADRPAGMRLDVGDIWNAQMTPLVNKLSYTRTRETSLSNLRLLHQLDQQLRVPPAACRDAAEFLLGATLYCPLDGDYVLRQGPGRTKHWTSTALETLPGTPVRASAPSDYQAPPLRWFRGLDVDALMNYETLAAHAEVIMQRSAKLDVDTER